MSNLKHLLTTLCSIGLMQIASAQGWTEVEVNLGASVVQGEFQDGIVGARNINPMLYASIHHRAAKSRVMSYGGSISTFSMYHHYDGDRNWLNGHQTEGAGVSAIASARVLLTGRDDMRFMKGALITYFEGGVGGMYGSYRTTYPPVTTLNKTEIDRPTQNFASFIGSASFGIQYYFDYKTGINFRFNGLATNTDELDGIAGITDKNDYQWNVSVGMLFAL